VSGRAEDTVPQVTIKTGFMTPDGREETLTEYICDYPDCPNYAEHVIGVAGQTGAGLAVCAEHAKRLQRQARDGSKS
jgi:hypothetical protein